jgi:hypothetical protein
MLEKRDQVVGGQFGHGAARGYGGAGDVPDNSRDMCYHGMTG